MAVSQKKKSDSKKDAAAPSNKKQYILLGVVILLFAFAGYRFLGSSGDEGEVSRPPVVPSAGPGPQGDMPGSIPMGPMVGPAMPAGPAGGALPPQTPTPAAAPVAGIQMPQADAATQRLTAGVDEYFKRYESAVKDGGWSKLAAWAYSHGLYVEAIYDDAMGTGFSSLPPKLHNTKVTIIDSTSGETKFVSQVEYEQTQTQKPIRKVFSYEKTALKIKELPSGGGSSNLSRLASLLVEADSLRGRQLYQESIKDKKFYPILIRAVKQTYLGQELENQAWEAGWVYPVPMNLWLVEQLVDLDPAVFEQAEQSKEGPKASGAPPMGPGGPGMPGMMGPGMMGPGMGSEPLPGLEHRKLMLSILSRRGGLVSSNLIGRLIAKDTNNTLLKGIMQGQVDPRLLRRFTGVYAEPMVDLLAPAFMKIEVTSAGWSTLVETLAALNNDRINYAIFSSASGQGVLSSKAVLMLATGGSGYALGELTKFVESGKVQDVPVESIFGLWTQVPLQARQSLWKTVSDFLPSVRTDDSQSMPSGDLSATGSPSSPANLLIRGRIKVPTGEMGSSSQGGGAMPQAGPPMGPNMPPGMPPGMPMMPGMAMPQGTSAQTQALRTFGWPVERSFNAGVDSTAAKKFLMSLGRLKVDTSKVTDSNMGRNAPMMGPPNMGMGGPVFVIDETGKAKVRQSAIRCLVVLDDPKLAEYFRSSIDDPQIGAFARLGLCILDDKQSIKPLLNHFWKNPLEINTVLPASGNASGASPSNPDQEKVIAELGKISVPLDAMGLPRAGCSARDAMIYFDNKEAGQAFLSALGEMITHKDAFEHPKEVADAACALISGLGRWSVPQTASTLADLIESTSDFGLRDSSMENNPQEPNPLAMQVRLEALAVLGMIGDSESMNVILRLATYSRRGELLGLAAQIALAKRGTDDAGDLFLDLLDPAKVDKNASANGDIGTQIAKIDPSLKSPEDIAFLGLSRIELNEIQIPRAIKLVQTLGESNNAQTGTVDLQEELVLSLLRAGQGPLLKAIAEMIGTPPQADASKEVFYWNRNGANSQDALFVKMVSALSRGKNEKDEAGTAAVVTAIVRREETALIPTQESQEWDPKPYLVQFNSGSSMSAFEVGMMPEMMAGAAMPNLPMPAAPGVPAPDSSAKASTKYEPGFTFPSMESFQGISQQTAALAGIKLLGKMSKAEQYLKPLTELSYYRYFAGFMLWQNGSDVDGQDLISLLAGPSSQKNGLYLKFLAIDQIQRLGNSKLSMIWIQALSKASDRAIQAKLADGVLYLAMQAWKDQMMGRTSALRDSQQVTSQVEALRSKIESRSYDRMLADRIVIILATLQENDQAPKWMTDIVRQQCSRSDPVSETAVGESVRILRSLNPTGKSVILDYYLAVLNQTVDPEKARQAAERSQSEPLVNRKMMDIPGGMGGMAGPGGRANRTPVVRSSGRSTPVKRSAPVPVYRSIGPMVVQAIGQMNLDETLSSLLGITKSRSDLLGSIAVEVYPRDNRQGQKLFRQLINDSGKNTDLSSQVRMAIAYLLTKNDPLTCELLVKSVIKSDSATSNESLQVLTKMYKDGKLPESFDIKNATKTILQGLMAEKRAGREVSQTMEAMIKFASELGDPSIDKAIERYNQIQNGPRAR
jgi:hypothetical protein